MKRTILLTTAALAVAFAPSLYAGPHGGGGGGGGHFGGGGGGHFGGGGAHFGGGASVHVQQMPHFEARVQQAPRAATQAQAFALRESAPSVRTTSQADARAVITNRSFETRNRQAPTIAFGGSTVTNANRNMNVQDNRSFGNSTTGTQTFSRGNFTNTRPPWNVMRNWDHRQSHTWNNHRFRWFNNSWVILGGGYYGSPYFYDYGSGPYYDYDSASYDDSAEQPPQYTSDSLAGSIQEELIRKGYNPGAVDGVIGPQTRNAIAQFQTDHRLPVTGRIDRAFLSTLNP